MQYAALARNYDLWMRQDQPLEDWIDAVLRRLDAAGIRPGARICDLACGTGGITLPLAQAGYDVLGVDLSEDMLSAARDKAAAMGLHTVRWLCQDMTQLDIPGRWDAVICACDGINYLDSVSKLENLFFRVKAMLAPGGIFVFDVSSPAKLLPMVGQIYSLDSDEGAYIWHNFEEEDHVVRMEITLFLPRADGAFERSDEIHRQRAHTSTELTQALKKAGFTDVSIREAFGEEKIKKDSRRWLVSAGTGKRKR